MSLDLLEKRIEALELQILPKDKNVVAEKSRAITDLLHQTQTMISTALSCREAITTILQNMNTINDYLDPNNGENVLEVEAKRHYLLELYPELKDTVQLLATVKSLVPYYDSANIHKVTELSDKLQMLAVSQLDVYEESRTVTQNVIKLLQEYSDITSTLKLLLAQLDKAVTDMEIAFQPKFTTEE